MSPQGELQGFINVKIPSRMKSRSFMPWKTWKRQWVVVRRSRSTRNGVELLIGRNSPTILQISADDIICRTESRTQHYAFGVFPHESERRANVYLSGTSETDSQKWIGKIRKLLKPALLPVEDNEFSVSVIDNFFTRSAGLSGLYGTLTVSSERVAIVDPFTSKTKVEWPWTTLTQFHVPSTITPEDKGRICTIVTSRSFPTGIGQIHLYCSEGVALTEKLRSRGRAASLVSSAERRFAMPTRHHTFSCNSPEKPPNPSAPGPLSASHAALRTPAAPGAPCLGRRLSRSEGNLLGALGEVDSGLYEFLEGRGEYDSEDKASSDSSECFLGKGKVAEGIHSGSVSLLLGTPGESEGDESLHEYRRLEKGDSDDDDDIGLLSFSIPTGRFSPPRRESGVSLASGVYEEIDDFSLSLGSLSPDLSLSANNESESPPPPLPPRREPSTRNPSDDGGYANALRVPTTVKRFLSRSAGSTPTPSPPCISKCQTVSAEGLAPKSGSCPWDSRADGDYLPMLPGCGFLRGGLKAEFAPKEALEEQHYMVMASIKGT